MKRKLLSILLIGVMVVGLTGCGNSSKEVNVVDDLNEIHSNCMKENDGSVCNMNWRLQEYLEAYSSYRLLNSSQKEFEVKPQEPKSLYSYGQSRDGVCAYKYALFYNNDNGNYYSVELECENNDSNPNFVNAKLLK